MQIAVGGALEKRCLSLAWIIILSINRQFFPITSVMGEKWIRVFARTMHIFLTLGVGNVNETKGQIKLRDRLYEFRTH